MTRIKDIATTTTTAAADDYVPLDGTTNGSRKILPGNLSPVKWLASYDSSTVSSLDIEDFAGDTSIIAVEIHIESLTVSSDGAGVYALFKLNGAYKTSNYKWASDRNWSVAAASDAGSNSDTEIELTTQNSGTGPGNAAGESMAGRVNLLNPNDTTNYKKLSAHIVIDDANATPRLLVQTVSGRYDGTDYASALGGIRISPSTGTMNIKCHVFALRAV